MLSLLREEGQQTQNMKKNCLNCQKVIYKKQNASLNSWLNRVKYCSTVCRVDSIRGTKASPSTRLKMRVAHMGNKSNTGRTFTREHLVNMSKAFKGSKHWNWQGGKTSLNHIARNCLEYKLWRKSVFERDNYTCQGCFKHGGDMHADHVKPFALFPELRYAIDNGRTLCVSCHKLTPTFSGKNFKQLYGIIK